MKIRNIPSEEWAQFLAEFSREHQGETVSVEIFGEDIGDQMQDRNLEFEGIVDQGKNGQRHELIIMTGKTPAEHITHTITRPLAVSVEESDDGIKRILAVMSADGVVAVLRFHKLTAARLIEEKPQMTDVSLFARPS